MNRKLEALRNLAERPGTEAEGVLAREILERLEKQQAPVEQVWNQFGKFMRSGSLDDLAQAVGKRQCPCGNVHPAFTDCPRTDVHERIALEIRERFPRGQRVFYNKWAYRKNCPAAVSGYSKEWNWIRLKFDDLKSIRAVPIYSQRGWHLSTEPVDDFTLKAADLREGMEKIDAVADQIAERYKETGS